MDEQNVSQLIIVTRAAADPESNLGMVAFFNADGTPFDFVATGPKGDKGDTGEQGPAATGANVLLTGMTTGTATPVAATDTVNVAIANLQAQIDALGT